jgi:hypothetical protein
MADLPGAVTSPAPAKEPEPLVNFVSPELDNGGPKESVSPSFDASAIASAVKKDMDPSTTTTTTATTTTTTTSTKEDAASPAAPAKSEAPESPGSPKDGVILDGSKSSRPGGPNGRLKLTKNQSTRLISTGSILPEKKGKGVGIAGAVSTIREDDEGGGGEESQGSSKKLFKAISKSISFARQKSVKSTAVVQPETPAGGGLSSTGTPSFKGLTPVGAFSPTGGGGSGGRKPGGKSSFKRKTTMVMGLKKVASLFSVKKKKTPGEKTMLITDRQNKQAKQWQQMVWDHLPGAEPQLKRFQRWKEDYDYFLKRHEDFDEMEEKNSKLLRKRGECKCRLSDQDAGPLDPWEYEVHCGMCMKRLPPFADQMVAMARAIESDPKGLAMAHRNALALEAEEEKNLLTKQIALIQKIDDERTSIRESGSGVRSPSGRDRRSRRSS